MSHDEPGGGRPPDAGDTGRPVAELARLAVEPPEDVHVSGFADRVRNRVERRSLGAHLGSLIWHAPGAVLMELLSMVFGFRGDAAADEGDSR
jgi:hypothetical protein